MADEIRLRPPPAPRLRGSAPVHSRAMAGSFWGNGSDTQPPPGQDPAAPEPQPGSSSTASSRPPATETLGRRAGALSDELDFPQFVASLIHGTWDAMVDSAIRQMDSFATLVAAISKPVEQLRDELARRATPGPSDAPTQQQRQQHACGQERACVGKRGKRRLRRNGWRRRRTER